jgi:hypothetical protein
MGVDDGTNLLQRASLREQLRRRCSRSRSHSRTRHGRSRVSSEDLCKLGAGVLVEARLPTDLPRDATNRSVHTPRNHSVGLLLNITFIKYGSFRAMNDVLLLSCFTAAEVYLGASGTVDPT